MWPTEIALPDIERNRLVRLCTRLTGAPEAAEDLAQEALLIAWQQRSQLRDAAKYAQWVNGIARNLCLHWLRSHQREKRYRCASTVDNALDTVEQTQAQPAVFDLEATLERHELAHLLDRALTLLPPLTRTVLIERFIHDAPQAEIAQRLRLTEGAVEARVQRGKATMRRVLMTQLQEDAVAYGLVTIPNAAWQTTRIWCSACGQRHLQGCFGSETPRSLWLQCACGANCGVMDIPGLLDNIMGFRAAYTRVAQWHYTFWQQGLHNRQVACPCCGQVVHVLLPIAVSDTYAIQLHCPACQQWRTQTDIAALAHCCPEVQQFGRAHPRMRTLPLRLVETNGASALLVTFQDVTSQAELDLLFDHTTFTRLTL
ncbi:MAG: RNA polymerase sigma factor [Caldilineaceae bacterium]